MFLEFSAFRLLLVRGNHTGVVDYVADQSLDVYQEPTVQGL